MAILALGNNSLAKEKKHGVDLLIKTQAGQLFKAELLTIKGYELILMDTNSSSGITIDIREIESIRIMKKSKFLQGLGYGLLIGGGTGGLVGLASGNDEGGFFAFSAGEKAVMYGIGLSILTVPIGGIIGALKGIDEIIVIEGKSEEEKRSILRKLNLQSRFPGKLSQSIKKTDPMMENLVQNSATKPIIPEKQIKLNVNNRQKPSSHKLFGVHLTYELGYFDSQGDSDLRQIYRTWGFADNKALYGWFSNWESIAYPSGESKNLFFLKNLKIEYSISKKFALGFMYAPLGKYKVQGFKFMKTLPFQCVPGKCYLEEASGIMLTGEFSGNSYYLVASYMPIPDAYLKKSSIKIGAGVGWSDIYFNFVISEKIQFSKKDLTYYGLLEYDYYFNPHFSIGLNIDYKYIPFRTEAFQSTAYYNDIDEKNNRFVNSMLINFSEVKINFGGFGGGINLGLHF
jgi:hypothetical protein